MTVEEEVEVVEEVAEEVSEAEEVPEEEVLEEEVPGEEALGEEAPGEALEVLREAGVGEVQGVVPEEVSALAHSSSTTHDLPTRTKSKEIS